MSPEHRFAIKPDPVAAQLSAVHQGNAAPQLTPVGWNSLSVVVVTIGLMISCDAAAQTREAQQPKTTPATVNTVNRADEAPLQDLLAGDWVSKWKHFSSQEGVALSAVWTVSVDESTKDRVLVCAGDPKGFLFTCEQFGDFELQLEWKYDSDPNGNSGVLIYTKDDMRLWPTSIQVQLHQPKAGSIFPSGDAETDHTIEVSGLSKEAGMWNTCRIVSRAGTLAVTVNEMKAGEVSGCKPGLGSIALQSEGSVVRFRRIRIRKLTTQNPAVDTTPPQPDAS